MDHVLWCTGHKLEIENITKAQGVALFDSNGKRYIDMESGVWCTTLGHNHPKMAEVIRHQLDKIVHTGYCFSNSIVEDAAKRVLEITGLSDGKCVFLCSGSEAVEFGIQAQRSMSDKSLLLTLSDSFLGSYGSASKENITEWYLADWSACSKCEQSDRCDPQCEVIAKIPFQDIVGFVFEPGSSSGFVRFPPLPLIKAIAKSVKEQAGFIQVNEVTTGVGRTGKWFGFQHYDIQPDIVSMGKGLGNGYPVSAIALSAKISDRLVKNGFHYHQSHQNDPLGCAVAKGVIDIIMQENLVEICRENGEYFLEKLLHLKEKYQIINDVRGKGLMIVIEFISTLEEEKIHLFRHRLMERGVIIARRSDSNTFRIDPPLNIAKEDLDLFLESFEEIVASISL